MPQSGYSSEESVKKKRIIGVIAIALLIIVTLLAFAGIITLLVWIILDLVIAGVANLLLRRVGRRPL